MESKLVEPLRERDARRSRFSRALPAPTARRVRILDDAARKDATGATFVRFAIDMRRGFFIAGDEAGWKKDAETGCAYLDDNQVFVRMKDRHYPADLLLGKKSDPAEPHTCQPAPEVAAAATPR